MIRIWIVCAALFWPAFAFAADQPVYAPPGDWVRPRPIPVAPAPAGAAVQYLLIDSQSNFDASGDAVFVETAAKALTPQGLATLGTVFSIWNPETDVVTIHRLHIIRGGQTIDLLTGGKTFTVLRRETNLELAMLDGSLTATFQPEGLQVGDVLDFAATIVRRDPVLLGYSQGGGLLRFPGSVAKAYFRAVWPASKPMTWRTTDGFGPPVVTHPNGGGELAYALTDPVTPLPPTGAPSRFNDLGLIELSQFKDWAEVSTLMSPLYVKASTLAPTSPLLAEAAKIRAASPDPKVRAAAALHLVQDQVRYLFLGMNLGGLKPTDADVTWTRRFGDCKGKTALLLALLHALDIEAEPALVSTTEGDGLNERLPMLSYFDHVMVRAMIDGKVYWLDGTRPADRGLDDIDIPNFGWVLPLHGAGAQLVKLSPPPAKTPLFESRMRLDASSGLDKKAPAHLEHAFHGDAGAGLHILFSKADAVELDRYLREYWRGVVPWIDVEHVGQSYDAAVGAEVLTMDGQATIDWQDEGGGIRDFDLSDSSLGGNRTFKRDPGPHQAAPYAVNYPMFNDRVVMVSLPSHGAGFSLIGPGDADQTTAGIAFRRTTVIAGGVVTMHTSERSIAPEFPASEAEAASAALTKLAERDVSIRAGAAYQATVPIRQSMPSGEPMTAEEYAARGFGRVQAREYDGAIADLTEAIKRNPKVKDFFYNRGVAHYEKGEDSLAEADFSQTLQLQPDDVLALLGRGETRARLRRQDDAAADFVKAQGLTPKGSAVADRVDTLYEDLGRYADGAAVYDRMLALPVTDQQAGEILNDRCWLRAVWGEQLDLAKADCDAALAKLPNAPGILDSRAMIYLRLKQYELALADYDAALKSQPAFAHALYGRGLAKRALGRRAEAEMDITAAIKADPGVDKTFAGYRLGL